MLFYWQRLYFRQFRVIRPLIHRTPSSSGHLPRVCLIDKGRLQMNRTRNWIQKTCYYYSGGFLEQHLRAFNWRFYFNQQIMNINLTGRVSLGSPTLPHLNSCVKEEGTSSTSERASKCFFWLSFWWQTTDSYNNLKSGLDQFGCPCHHIVVLVIVAATDERTAIYVGS